MRLLTDYEVGSIPHAEHPTPQSMREHWMNLNGKWGFIALDKKVVIPFEYDEVGKFGCGLANIKKGDKWGYINEQNELIIACKYDCCETFRNGKATVWLDWKFYTIDTEGNTVECDNEDGLPF